MVKKESLRQKIGREKVVEFWNDETRKKHLIQKVEEKQCTGKNFDLSYFLDANEKFDEKSWKAFCEMLI